MKYFFCVIVLALLLSGCSDENKLLKPSTNNLNNGVSMLITQNPLNYVGIDHNMFLDSHVHTDTVWNLTNYESMINLWIDTCSTLGGNYADMDSITIYYFQSQSDLNTLIDTSVIDPIVKGYLLTMKGIISDTTQTLQESMDDLTTLESTIMNDDTSDSLELNIALISIAVERNSLYYWANNSILTQGVHFKKTAGSANSNTVRKIAEADGDAAIWSAMAFFTFGGAGISMVGGPGVFFASFTSTVLVSAATSSAKKALTGEN